MLILHKLILQPCFKNILCTIPKNNNFEEIKNEDKTPVLCGGTGFYIRAAIDDYDFPKGEQADNPLRDKYQKIAEDKGAHEL